MFLINIKTQVFHFPLMISFSLTILVKLAIRSGKSTTLVENDISKQIAQALIENEFKRISAIFLVEII